MNNFSDLQMHLMKLHYDHSVPIKHIEYIKNEIKNKYNFNPKVVYDIGSCVLQWTSPMEKLWPNAKFVLFEAMEEVEFLYNGYLHHLGVLSDQDFKNVAFYKNTWSPGGNSYYKEIGCGEESKRLFNDTTKFRYTTRTVDSIVKEKNFPLPDLIKIDVQGCEVDILKGMTETIKSCKHLIIELQHSQYNEGAPLNTESVPFIESLGFTLITPLFYCNGPDGDYHFINNNIID
jgi:FkbM family methyltransferase